MKRLWLSGLILLWSGLAYGAPSNSISVPNSFVAGTSIKSADTNANNNEIQSKFNAHTHSDITQLGTVTVGGWAGSTIAIAYGGTGQASSAAAMNALSPLTTSGDILSFDGTRNKRVPATTIGWVLVSGTAPAFSFVPYNAQPTGSIVQVANYATGGVAMMTATIADDDSIPQLTEGQPVMSLSITPRFGYDKLKIDVSANLSIGGNDVAIMSLYQDVTADALCTVRKGMVSGDSGADAMTLTHYVSTIGGSTPTTFYIRAGAAAGNAITLNGGAGSRKLGGKLNSSITITEIKG
jgi:hypothetical protein